MLGDHIGENKMDQVRGLFVCGRTTRKRILKEGRKNDRIF
jgi:hypothetical protein